MRLALGTFVVLVAVALAASSGVSAQRTDSADSLLRQAADRASVDGDLPAAIKIYQSVVDRFAKTDRASAATALIRMAECQQKLGDSQAKATLEKIVKDFSDQTSQVAEARTRLTGLAGLAVRASADGRTLICEGTHCSSLAGTVSRDGKWIVMGGGVWRGALGIRNVETGEVTRLPVTLRAGDEDAQAAGEVFSSDGRQIAFAWLWLLSGAGNTELRVISREPGAKARVLVENADGSATPVTWSRDGSRILTRLDRKDGSVDLAWISTADGAIKVVKSLGWRTRTASASGLPEASLSPDERFIVYSALVTPPSSAPEPGARRINFETAEQHLYVIPADGGGPEVELTKTRGIDHNPIWSADGRHVLFSSNRAAGSVDLWALPIKSGNVPGMPFRVKSGIGTYYNTGVTDSGFLYYWQVNSALREVHVVDLDTTGKLPATPRLTARIPGRLPSWSPDGSLLAMSEAGANADSDKVVIHSLQTGEARIIASPGSPDKPAIWLPDSRGFLQIVLSSRRPVARSWTRFDPNTGTLQPIKHLGNPGSFAPPALSRDGRTIYRLGGELLGPNGEVDGQTVEYNQIVAVDTSTGTESTIFKLANHRGSAMGPALSPDGRTLAFQWQPSQKLGTWILATVAIDGTGYREVTTTERPASVLSWARDGRGLLFAQNAGRGSPCRLMRVSSGGGSHEFTGLESAFSAAVGCSLSVSPDGKRVAFQIGLGAQELWAIDVSEAALLKKAR